ncbi:hypothetical protein BC828DRAFT_181107 [Blastocladiella britannica]|nr:hypothetical protein BC828DRAFT_181107 [Blastocladiella britannica]
MPLLGTLLSASFLVVPRTRGEGPYDWTLNATYFAQPFQKFVGTVIGNDGVVYDMIQEAGPVRASIVPPWWHSLGHGRHASRRLAFI